MNDDLWDRVCGLGSETFEGWVGVLGASGVPGMPTRSRNSIPDILRTISIKVSIKDGKICN